MKLLGKMLLLVFFWASLGDAEGFDPKTFVIKDMVGLDSYLAGGSGGRGSIYNTINKKFKSSYEKIGSQEINRMRREGKPSFEAGINHIGMVYSSNFADFSIYLKRELAPDLFDDERYIVIDNLDIYIDAQKFLKNLKDADLIGLTKAQYDAFGSVSFKRSYRYVHFADSFDDALNLNLDKLFFAFEILEEGNYLKMSDYEIISREDSLTVGAGARASASLGHGVGLEMGGFVEFDRISKLEVQSVGPEDESFENERFRISFEKKKGEAMMGYTALNADFLNILRLTLFQYEFSYHYLDSYRVNLGFKEKDIDTIREIDSPLGDEVEKLILTGQGNLKVLKPFLVSYEHRRKERHTSRYSLLLRGKSKECQTSEVKIVKDNKVKQFFRHTLEHVKYNTNFISKLFSSLLNTFLSLDGFVQETKDAYQSRRVCVEYESNKNLMHKSKDLFLDDTDEKLSLKFEETYYVHNPKGKVRARCADVLENCPGVDPKIIDDVRKGKFKADLKIRTNYIINREAINYFNKQSVAEIYDAIHYLCAHAQKRDDSGAIVKYGKSSKKCERELQEYYDRYFKELIAHNYSWDDYQKCDRYAKKYVREDLNWAVFMEVCIHRSSLKAINPWECSLPLWHFRNFVDRISDHTNKKEDMYAFFGLENVFFYGYLQGRTVKGNYKACFKDGNFSGTGLIDNYMRREKMRPASLLIVE